MSLSVTIPETFPLTSTSTSPMSNSRIPCAASASDADAGYTIGFEVMSSRTVVGMARSFMIEDGAVLPIRVRHKPCLEFPAGRDGHLLLLRAVFFLRVEPIGIRRDVLHVLVKEAGEFLALCK